MLQRGVRSVWYLDCSDLMIGLYLDDSGCFFFSLHLLVTQETDFSM